MFHFRYLDILSISNYINVYLEWRTEGQFSVPKNWCFASLIQVSYSYIVLYKFS